ncbi:MAG: endonuclease III [Gemmataceae bacterium]|nr:endonuclease III [Gemmataceae bacterium]
MLATAEKKRYARRVVKKLREAYPGVTCALVHRNPLELLVATILSAQCTDVRVNQVTPALFARYPTAAGFAAADLAELEKMIQSTGFFRNKAKSIRACCEAIATRYDGQVPQDLDALVALPGVGRKTANVVLGTAFGLATGVVVDTHVTRVSRRLGLTKEKEPVKIERELMALLPRRDWVDFSHLLIHHGRQICIARKPKCDECVLGRWCPRIGVTQRK